MHIAALHSIKMFKELVNLYFIEFLMVVQQDL